MLTVVRREAETIQADISCLATQISDYNRSSGPLSIVSSSSSDVGEVTIHGITADGTVIETLNLDGIGPCQLMPNGWPEGCGKRSAMTTWGLLRSQSPVKCLAHWPLKVYHCRL